MFPKDISHPPREWAERFFNVQRWTEMPSGGHFAAMAEPERLVDDIRAFFRPLRVRRGNRGGDGLLCGGKAGILRGRFSSIL